MADPLIQELASAGIEHRAAEPLAAHTTVRVGGPARVMVFPHDTEGLSKALAVARRAGTRVAVLGGGANFFADSRGVDAMVVQMVGFGEPPEIDDEGLMVVGAGAVLRDVALGAARRGWAGIDFMAEVPGTIGGAVVINAGTNVGGYVADRLEWAETVDFEGRTRRYTKDELEFDYRMSRLLGWREIVTRAALRLEPCERLGTSPQALRSAFDAAMAERARKFPLDQPNFGSTFRSPGRPHPPAGKLLDDLGMKGTRVGGAQISEKHANFIVNLGDATSDDVLELMRRMHDIVLDRHGIALRAEVRYLCDPDRERPDFLGPPDGAVEGESTP